MYWKKTKWTPPLKCYIYLILSISNYHWHIHLHLHIQYTNSSSDSIMNINSCNPLEERVVSDSLELMNPFFLSNEIDFLACLKKNNIWSKDVAIRSGEKDQAHPAFDLVIWQPGLPATESFHLWYDKNQTPLLSITHRCLQVTSYFAQYSCNSLDILWDGNCMAQNDQNMNQVGQSMSLYPMTPKRSLLLESISMVFCLMGNDSTKMLPWFYYDSYFDCLFCILILLLGG